MSCSAVPGTRFGPMTLIAKQNIAVGQVKVWCYWWSRLPKPASLHLTRFKIWVDWKISQSWNIMEKVILQLLTTDWPSCWNVSFTDTLHLLPHPHDILILVCFIFPFIFILSLKLLFCCSSSPSSSWSSSFVVDESRAISPHLVRNCLLH